MLDRRMFDGESRPIKVDSLTNALTIIDYAHHEIHEGSSFYSKDVVGPLAASVAASFLVRVGTMTAAPHMIFEVSSAEGRFEMTFFSSATVSTTGTAVTLFNSNQNSAKTPITQLFSGAAFSASGTQIYKTRVGASKKSGSASRALNEIIFKANTDYQVQIRAVDPSITVSYLADFYEKGSE